MKKKILLFLATFTTLNLFCAEIGITIKTGEQWKKRNPQVAVWIEDENENYIATVYVTKGAAKKAWKFSPKEGRPDSLPVWYNASKINPSEADKTDKDLDKKLDAVTSATPKKNIVTGAKINLQKNKTYIVKAEVNQSFDYNEKWTKKNSGVNGQPSVIYKKSFVYSANETEINLQFFGTGSVDGSNGKIYFENENLTTAKKIVDNICITFTKSEIY